MIQYKNPIKFLNIKSVVFCTALLGLFACDQLEKKIFSHDFSDQDNHSIISKPVVQKQATRSRETLIRAVYTDVVIHPEKINSTEQTIFLRDILEGLVIYNPQGEVIPAVAESWQTEDNKSWVFTLRDTATWSNGKPVIAEDFVKSWRHLANSDSPLKNYLTFMNLKNAQEVIAKTLPLDQLGVFAIDDKQLAIELDKETPYLPEMLAHVSLLPQYLYEHKGFVTNGAYTVLNQQNDFIYLAKNPYYWSKDRVSFNFVDYKKVSEKDDVTTVDVVFNPNTQYFQSINFLPKQCIYFYTFNFSHPELKKLAVRQALKGMISNKHLTPENMLPVNSILPHSLQLDVEDNWSYVLVEKLLQHANFTEKTPFVFELVYDQGVLHSDIALQLIQMWSQSDLLRVKPRVVTHEELLQRRAKGDFDVIRSGWCSDYKEPSAFLSQFHSQSPDNQTGYNNSKIDKLLDQTTENTSPENRYSLYQDIITELQSDVAILPIFQYTEPYYWDHSISGIDIKNDTGVIYSKDLYRKVEVEK